MDRKEMEAVLAGGGTVLHKGQHIQRHSELPSEAELALESGSEDEALKSLNEKAAKLAAEKEELEKSLADKKAAKAAAKEEKAGPEKLAEVVHEKDDSKAKK